MLSDLHTWDPEHRTGGQLLAIFEAIHHFQRFIDCWQPTILADFEDAISCEEKRRRRMEMTRKWINEVGLTTFDAKIQWIAINSQNISTKAANANHETQARLHTLQSFPRAGLAILCDTVLRGHVTEMLKTY